jgi:hypothetical protein
MSGGITFDVRDNIEDAAREIGMLAKDVPFMAAYALTKTAQDIHAEERKVMAEVFDRPTRFTLNSLYVKPATKTDLASAVLPKEGFGSIPAWRFLGPQIEGGPRQKKSHERALERAGILNRNEYVVPGAGVKLDSHGNVPGPTIVRILSQLGAAERSAGYKANMTNRSRKRSVRRAGGQYFVMRKPGAPPGIYQRANQGAPVAGGVGPTRHQIIPVLLFVSAPTYAPRFPFHEIAQRVFAENFDRHFRIALLRYGNRPARQAA